VVLVKKVWQLLRQLPQQVGRTGVHAAGCGLSGCKATVKLNRGRGHTLCTNQLLSCRGWQRVRAQD